MTKLYTEEELKFLKDNYIKYGPTKCAKLLKRPYNSVQKKANNLGLRQYESVKWTLEEDNIIKEFYPYRGSDLQHKLPKRSTTAIQKRADNLGVKQGTSFYKDVQGYVIYSPRRDIKLLVHRVLMEIHLQRRLTFDEVVHHKNGNREDNRIENLEVLKRSEHINFHR